MFEPVERRKAKLRMSLTGVSGAGKTLGALYIAYGITNDWAKIALIDTEHERGRFYANRSDLPTPTGAFLYQSMTAPFSPDKYISYVAEAAKAVGSDGVIIVDSFSHAWDNEGGVLDIKSGIAQRAGKNDYTAWDEAGKIQNNLVNTILAADAHTIITMRAKMAYAMEQNDKGKMQPVKIGLAPVQRDNTEYEFDIAMNISRDHTAVISKDTTFLDSFSGVITPEIGKQLHDWLDKGTEPERCADCGCIITAYKDRTSKQIAEGSLRTYGRKLCIRCVAAEMKKQKEMNGNAAQTVSE